MHKQQILEKSINRITIKRKYVVKEPFMPSLFVFMFNGMDTKIS